MGKRNERMQRHQALQKGNNMDESKFKAIAAGVMSNEAPLAVSISIKEAWLLISGLQLITRHPEISKPLKAQLEHIARQFQAAITETHPEVAALIEMDRHVEHDVP